MILLTIDTIGVPIVRLRQCRLIGIKASAVAEGVVCFCRSLLLFLLLLLKRIPIYS